NAGKVLREGAIVASLGIGGFHLLVRADSPEAVHRLRVRKHRPWKPLAIMCREVSELGDAVKISPIEREILHSVEAPIVLLEKTGKPPHFVGIADGSPCLGVMLASTPLYWLLLENVGVPLVATSGNISDSPICYTIQSGLQQLAPVADYFLVHNRRIVRRCDDSVIRVISEKPRLIRRARGFVPISLELPLLENVGNNQEFLGVGGHQKSCLCLLCKNTILPSAHLGDLTSSSARL
ncbi:MAG: Sua5/YciO/YrdC/YwlC family protein, partial [Chthoniobacterales bacterium]|nr:Sua5/YciO/YrdC/YwlC family protein [Chthoniobacterales bacterium]